jgi:uncharacterized protein (DUF433 family)
MQLDWERCAMGPISIIDRGRGPELAGTRITVFDLIPYLEAGRSPDYIASVLELSMEEVNALMRYIEEHRVEVMVEHTKIEERIKRGNPPEVEALLQNSPTHALIQARLTQRLRQRTQEDNGASDPG